MFTQVEILARLLGPLACLGFFALPLIVLGIAAGGDLRGIRRLLRERRFGLLAIFLVTAAVAVAMALLRVIGADFTDPSILCVGAFALGVGTVAVGLVWLMFSDRLERGESRKLRSKVRTPDVQVSPPNADRGQWTVDNGQRKQVPED
jgi:hypothetical protein